MREKFWMIYGEGQRAPTVKHASYEIAKQEAERLCRNNPGIDFFVLQPVSVSKRVDVETKMLLDEYNDPPF